MTNGFLNNPMTLAGLAVMQGGNVADSLVQGQKAAYQMQEQQRAQQIRDALANIDLSDPNAIQQVMRLDPDLGVKLMQQQRLKAQQEQEAALLSGGADTSGMTDIDRAYMMAESDNPMVAGRGKAMVAEIESERGLVDARAKEELKQEFQTAKEKRSPADAQSKAYGFAERMLGASKALPDSTDELLAGTGQAALGSVPGAGNFMITPEYQAAKQAATDWITANLRKESGAVIGVEEMETEFEKYFPQPGDGEKVIEQKRKSRELAEKGMIKASGALGEELIAGSDEISETIPDIDISTAKRAPDGKLYVEQDGVFYEVSE